MKKMGLIFLTVLLVTVLAACSNQPKKTSGKKQNSASSQTEIKKPSADYRIKTEKYTYSQDNRDYRAFYPQLTEEAQNYQKANELLKSTALKTIQEKGTAKAPSEVKIRVEGNLNYRLDDFISVAFEETVLTYSDKKEVKAFRTVNYDLKNGKALSTADLIKENDALDALMLKAAKKRVGSGLEASVTKDVIQKGMKNCSLSFKKSSFIISLPVSHELKDAIEVELKYEEIKPFITDHALWKEIGLK